MSRRCEFTGKSVLVGNNVSHANNKTKRRYLPNLQQASLVSDLLGETVRVRLTTGALRTVEKNGGLDAFLLSAKTDQLGKKAREIKRRIERAKAKQDAAAA
ncbi:MAG: 50S ribosomal protein L28 [Pseudomonadota bacterium]